MTLTDLASPGSFISGVSVLASLGFLYFQMPAAGNDALDRVERDTKSGAVAQ